CSARAHTLSLRRTSGVNRKATRSDNTSSSYMPASFRHTNEHRISENIELVCEKTGQLDGENWTTGAGNFSRGWESSRQTVIQTELVPISYATLNLCPPQG